jgi:hypothetical protein
MPEARLRTTDLRSDLALAIRHHEVFLGAKSGQLLEKQVNLKLVTDALNQTQGSLSGAEKIRLLEITGEILDVLAGQCGELRSSVEKEVPHG